MGAASVSFSASGETTLLFPQVNFRGSRGSRGCWAERTRAEKQLLVLVGVLAVLLVACLLGLIFQYRASKSFAHFLGVRTPRKGRILGSASACEHRGRAAYPSNQRGWFVQALCKQLRRDPASLTRVGCWGVPRMQYLGQGWDAYLHSSAQDRILGYQTGYLGVGWDFGLKTGWSPAPLHPRARCSDAG